MNMYLNRPDASPREQLADTIWNTGRRISELSGALKNNERRFGKNGRLPKAMRAEIKELESKLETLRKEFNGR